MDSEAIREQLEAELARRSLIKFVKRLNKSYIDEPVHHLVAGMLECVEAGVIKRLILMTQPRLGKSALVSVYFPAWFLGRNPGKQYLAASHTQELADDLSGYARDCLNHERWPFEAQIDPNARGVHRWKTTGSGVYRAYGVGGGTTGVGGDIISVDDPLKGDEAYSVERLDDLWNWYSDKLRTRVMPGAAVVLTHTRWNDIDLAGRLIKAAAEGGEQWVVLKMPAWQDSPDGHYYAEVTLPDALAEQARVDPLNPPPALEVVARLKALAGAVELRKPPKPPKLPGATVLWEADREIKPITGGDDARHL